MKAVLMSIQPKWCELIALGKKTVEVRKTKPNLETPFKVYIYCTQGKFADLGIIGQEMYEKRCKVIGEFVCNGIDDFKIPHPWVRQIIRDDLYRNSCVSFGELYEYSNGGRKLLYAWHISDLVVYDKPRELWEFKTFCKSYDEGDKCDDCKYFIDGRGYEYDESDCGCNGLKPITRPPQSWCYVERSEGYG